ncbi:MAG: phosphotransferase [Patescibacteria group bacterium]|jgi:thiamine kinase-like enzyme
MNREQLQFFLSEIDSNGLKINENVLSSDFSFDLDQISHLVKTNDECKTSNALQVTPLVNGFNLDITGGGIFKVNDEVSKQSFILKSVPPFEVQQNNMLQILDQMGEQEFAQILEKYPSNHLSRREILSYCFLEKYKNIKIPQMYLGVLNQLTEQAWIFIEDLSALETISNAILSKKITIISNTVNEMAEFHSEFWNKDLQNEDWLGRWWTNRNNDFVAYDVTSFALEKVIQLHADVISPSLKIFLRSYLQNRAAIQSSYQEFPQTVIHWDLGSHNMKFNIDNNQATIFDWELTSLGLPQWDLAQFLLPMFGSKNADQITHYVETYWNSLSQEIRNNNKYEDFIHMFDLVVLDHFFRVCGPIIFAGKEIDKNSYIYIEWINCLSWIQYKFLNLNE